MSDIKFKFDYFNESNTLIIEGTKELFGKNYVCSVRGSLHDIDLQEVLNRITMSIQNKIIEDCIEPDVIKFTKNDGVYTFRKLGISEEINKLKSEVNELKIKIDTLI